MNNLSGTVTVAAGATLDMGSNNLSSLIINASGAGVGAQRCHSGELCSNAAVAWGPSVVNMTGNLTIGGNNRWDIRQGANQFNVTTTNNTLTKVGAGFTALVGTTVSPNLGDIYILGGKLSVENGSTLGNTNNTVYIGSSGALDFYGETVPFTKNIVITNNGNGSITGSGGTGPGNNVILSPLLFTNGNTTITISGGPLTFGTPINIPSGCTLNNDGNYYNTYYYSNVISGSGTFYQQYQTYINLYASNTFSGTITVPYCNAGNAGAGTILRLIGNGSISQAPNIIIQGVTAGQAWAGTLDVSGRVDGTLTLSPNQTLRGDYGSRVIGTVVVGPGSTIWPGGDNNTNFTPYIAPTNFPNLTVSALTMNGGVLSFDVLTTTNDQIIVSNTLSLTGGGAIRVVYPSLNTGRYHLIKFGSKTGSVASLKLALNGPHYTAHLDDTNTPNWVDLVIDSNVVIPPQPLVWAGDGVNNYWDSDLSTNWLNAGAPAQFFGGDNVNFTDPGTNPVVNMVSSLSPGSITVNSAANYIFGGSGTITGTTSLLKTNTGTLTVSNANTFTGGTVINGGTLVMANAGALWNNSNSVASVANGGTLDMAGSNPNAMTINLSGAGVGGNGALVSSYVAPGVSPNTSGPSVVNLAGSATIGVTSSNRFSLRNGLHTLNCPTNAYSLTKVGTGYVDLYTTLVSSNLGDVYVLGGILGYQGSCTGLGNPTNTLYIGTNGILEMYSSSVPLNKNIVCSNGASIQPDNGGGTSGTTPTTVNIISGPIYLAGPNGVANPAQINCNYNNGCAISNSISGPGGLTFNYNAYNRLYAPNTYQGDSSILGGVYLFANSSIVSTNNIYINAGPLWLTNNASVGTSTTYINDNYGGLIVGGAGNLSFGLMRVGGALLDVSGRTNGTLTLTSNEVLRVDNGAAINGNIVAGSGSVVSPGGSGYIQNGGVFTNALTFQSGSTYLAEVSLTGGVTNNDAIKVLGTVTYGGTLQMANIGNTNLTVGASFKLFTATNYLNNFSNIVDATGTTWSFTPATGIATVTALPPTVNTNPATANFRGAFSGGALHFTWAPDHLGWQLYTNAVGLTATNSWFPLAGSANGTNATININPAHPNVFFQLRYP